MYVADNGIDQVYTVLPTDSEKFNVCLLLLRVKVLASFENIRTVNGYQFSASEEAALQRRFHANDSLWQTTLEDAVIFETVFCSYLHL
jgi:hypothetical protein